MVASGRRSRSGRRGGDSDEVRRGDAMGREIFWGSNEGAHLLRRQVSAKARETAWTVGRCVMTNQRRQT
jgi:hypothetical protein